MAANLLSLPRELRDRIHEYVVCTQAREEVVFDDLLHLHRFRRGLELEAPRHLSPNYNFLFSHPQICDEGFDLIYNHPLVIENVDQLRQAEQDQDLKVRQKCTKLILNARDWDERNLQSALEFSADFEQLEHLEIRVLLKDDLLKVTTPDINFPSSCLIHNFPKLGMLTIRDLDYESEQKGADRLSVALEGSFGRKRSLQIRKRALHDLNRSACDMIRKVRDPEATRLCVCIKRLG